ncbi:MAG: Ig-like domain-containing protein, partial [Chloroflexi bacterium]|nr:Ig-like domain-containing protein [Chloroflexota bacterium]
MRQRSAVRPTLAGAALLTLILASSLAVVLTSAGSASEYTEVPSLLRLERAENVDGQAQGVGGDVTATTWEPPVIFNNGIDTVLVSLAIQGGDFDSAWVSAEGLLDADTDVPEDVALFDDIADDLIRIYDDGTHGDLTAGDGVFSRGGVTSSQTLQHDGGSHERLSPSVFFFRRDLDNFVRVNSSTLDSGLGIVDESRRDAAQVVAIGPGLTASTHALFLVDDGTIYPNYPNVDADAAVDVCEACGVIIEEFGDEFDFIILQSSRPLNEVPSCDCQAFFKGTRNDAQGIGVELRDINVGPDTFSGGDPFNTFSDGQLRGIIWSNTIDGSALSHEVMHRWSVNAALERGWLDGEGHFLATNTVRGMMDLDLLQGGGSLLDLPGAPGLPVDLVANGDGTFRLVSRPGEFNATFDPMSLYLAGFIPPSQVPSVELLEGQIDPSDPNAWTASSVRTISVDDVIASEGPRLPSSVTAEKDFRVGTIVISDRAFSEAEYAFITLALRYWESDAAYDGSGAPPWNAATNGISTITVALPGIAFAGDPAAITVAAGDVTVPLGGETTVTATVRDDAGVPVRDVSVVFGESLSSATISADPVTTDGNGEATATFTADELGGFTITATVVEITDGVVVETALSTVIEVEVVEPPATRTQTLRPQWNLVGWTGETIDVTEATASILASLGAFFTWDAAASNFLTFNPALPPALNSLRQVPQGAGIWTFVNGNSNVAWEQPAFNEARAVSL